MAESANRADAIYKVTLRGTLTAVTVYGIVEFLRAHPLARGASATIGVLLAIVCIAGFVGIKPSGLFTPTGVSPLGGIFAALALLWASTVSGSKFELVFPEAEASKERQKAETQFETTSTPEDALTLDLKRLNEYYLINQSQARSSFRWAIFSMILGLGTIITGIWIFYFQPGQPDKFMAGLSTAAGCVVNVISGLFLYLHSKIQERSLHYYQQLAASQKLAMAIRLVDAHQDPAQQRAARDLVIHELLSISHVMASTPGVSDSRLRATARRPPKAAE